MFIDARGVGPHEEPQADVCIIGGGAAGITLAQELAQGDRRVILLESGGFDYEVETQALYEGELAGVPMFPLNLSRLRYLGGSTNHWGGLSRPLDPADFQPRAGVPDSGWPFDYEHMKPYYRRAQVVCELGPYAYGAQDWESDERPRWPLPERIETHCYQNSTPTRFGERYREVLDKAPNVHVFLHANAVELHPDADVGRVTHVQVATLAGNRFRVKAGAVVLASGGIENARLLLASNSRQPAGLGNAHDLVGRYFMEHPTLTSGLLLFTDASLPVHFYLRHRVDDVPVHAFLRPSDAVMAEDRLLNCSFMARQRVHWSDQSQGVEALKGMVDGARERTLPDGLGSHMLNVITDIENVIRSGYGKARGHQLLEIHYQAEQCPNRDSRVTPAEAKDPFGKPRARVDWRLTEADRRNVDRTHALLAAALGEAGLGRLHLEYDASGVWSAEGMIEAEASGDAPAPVAHAWQPRTSHHHMGTTRIHPDPRRGVVDANCRVHGLANVYVAGSSVFPTVGHAAPTLTIVALAIRLADHLKRVAA